MHVYVWNRINSHYLLNKSCLNYDDHSIFTDMAVYLFQQQKIKKKKNCYIITLQSKYLESDYFLVLSILTTSKIYFKYKF
jgi:hypothetical protein